MNIRHNQTFRPIAVVGFGVSIAALLVLLGFCFDADVRPLLVAQFTPGLIWHLPPYVSAVARLFMVLNIPTVLVGELLVRTMFAHSKPEYRAISNFAVWWTLTPLWWWFVGKIGYRGKRAA